MKFSKRWSYKLKIISSHQHELISWYCSLQLTQGLCSVTHWTRVNKKAKKETRKLSFSRSLDVWPSTGTFKTRQHSNLCDNNTECSLLFEAQSTRLFQNGWQCVLIITISVDWENGHGWKFELGVCVCQCVRLLTSDLMIAVKGCFESNTLATEKYVCAQTLVMWLIVRV